MITAPLLRGSGPGLWVLHFKFWVLRVFNSRASRALDVRVMGLGCRTKTRVEGVLDDPLLLKAFGLAFQEL